MTSSFLRWFFISCFVWQLQSCATQSRDSQGFTILSETELPSYLAETSGLYCDNGMFYTVNDSGNEPVIYQLAKEKSPQALRLALSNKDWEAITGTPTHFYVADIGNNAGKREDLAIHKIARDDVSVSSSIRIVYEENTPIFNLPLAHDFDAEALTVKDNALVMFSKSWSSGVVNVYQLNANDAEQTLRPVTQINDLPGIVTGADYDVDSRKYYLVGYKTTFIGLPKPFLVILDESYQQEHLVDLRGFGQVEGVCSHADSIWFTQEDNHLSPAKLVEIQIGL
jgi:hypothetical protein